MTTRKICFFNSTKAWGGGEKWHFDIASRFHTKYGNVFVVAGKRSELARRLGPSEIPCHEVGIGNLSFLSPFKIIKLIRLFRKERPDVVIMNLPADLKAAGIAARLAGVNRIIYRRGSAIAVKNTLLNRCLFKHVVDEIIANSEETARALLARNHELFPKDKIHVIYNGVDWAAFESSTNKPFFRPKEGAVVLGNAGRLVPQKGQEILIEVAKQLEKKGFTFEIVIAGEGELKESLLHRAAEEGVDRHLHFLGFVEDMPRFLRSIDIFLLPSRWEGFGYVIAEAMYCEKPVIAFDVSSNPEIVADEETGFLVRNDDVGAFVEKTELLINHEALRLAMGKRARAVAVERFSIENTFVKMEQLLGFSH